MTFFIVCALQTDPRMASCIDCGTCIVVGGTEFQTIWRFSVPLARVAGKIFAEIHPAILHCQQQDSLEIKDLGVTGRDRENLHDPRQDHNNAITNGTVS